MKVQITKQARIELDELPDPARQSLLAVMEDIARRPDELDRVSLHVNEEANDVGTDPVGQAHTDEDYRVMGVRFSDAKRRRSSNTVQVIYTVSDGSMNVRKFVVRQETDAPLNQAIPIQLNA